MSRAKSGIKASRIGRAAKSGIKASRIGRTANISAQPLGNKGSRQGTYIIKFEDERSRRAFQKAALSGKRVRGVRLQFAEFLPDVIVSNVSPETLSRLRRLAGDKAEFVKDYSLDLFP